MAEAKKQSLLNGALILSGAVVMVKILSMFFKLYVANKIGYGGAGLYSVAYDLYTPIYSIALAGLPTAVSKMVASELAQEHYQDVKKLFTVSNLLFALMGVLGTALLVLSAYPFAAFQGSPSAVPSIIAIAPSVFFCCVMSGYRGYYQGHRNMTPSAVSQIFEAAGKLIFGWLFLNIILGSSMEFAEHIPIFNKVVTNVQAAYASAAAILGVTAGSVIGLLYLFAYRAVKKDGVTASMLERSTAAQSRKALAKQLIRLSIPISISAVVFNLTTLIDNLTVGNRLFVVLENHFGTVADMYPAVVEALGFTPDRISDFKDYLFGAYNLVLEIKNVVPTFTITLGLSALPILSESWVKKDLPAVRHSIEAVVRLSMLIALPAGVGMMVLADDLLYLLFGSSDLNAPAIPYIAPILILYGVSVVFLALVQPIIAVLQAVDRMDVPIKGMLIGAVVKVIANLWLVSIPSVNIQGAVVGSILCNVIMVVYALVVLAKETDLKYRWGPLFFRPLGASLISGAAGWLTNSIFEKALPPYGLTFVSRFLTTDNIACIMGVFAAVIFYVFGLFALRAVTKEDISVLPGGRKIAKRLAKYGLLG